MTHIESDTERLPLDYPLSKALDIYAKRLGAFFLVVLINLLILAILLWGANLPNFPPTIPVLLSSLLPAIFAIIGAILALGGQLRSQGELRRPSWVRFLIGLGLIGLGIWLTIK